MRLETLIDSNIFELVNKGDDLDRDIKQSVLLRSP